MNKPYIYDLKHAKEQSSKNLFNVVSLFAGGGGSSTGYRLAGGKVLAINEFVPAAQTAYAINYPDTHIFTQDVRELTGEMILNQIGLKRGELDILDGSPPCASFSTAGLREKAWGRIKSYSDTQQRTDDLFFEFVRLVDEIKPKVFVAENVQGLTMGAAAVLLGSEQLDLFGEYKETIYHQLRNVGYNVRFKVMYAKDYGVPQTRPRVIFIGVRNDIDKPISYPKKSGVEIPLKDAFANILHTDEDLKEVDISRYFIHKESIKLKPGEQSDKYFSLMKMNPEKCSNTLTQTASVISAASIVHWEDRKFTIKEAIRIMSFPDDYYLGETYKQKIERLGRAVAPVMYKHIVEHIHKTILQ